MKLYAIADECDRLLAETCHDCKPIKFGTFVPGKDGNYYQNLFIFAYKSKKGFNMGAEGYIQYVKTVISEDPSLIEPEFAFDVEDLRVVEFVMKE